MSEITAEEVCSTCQQPLHDSLVIEINGEVFKIALNAPSKQVKSFCANMMILLEE